MEHKHCLAWKDGMIICTDHDCTYSMPDRRKTERRLQPRENEQERRAFKEKEKDWR